MAIDTMDKLVAGLSGEMRFNFCKPSVTAEGAGTFQSLFKVAGNPTAGANPASGSGAIPTSTTAGAIPFTNNSEGNTKYIGRINMSSSTACSLIIYDRIWANSGLVGNITTSQAVSSSELTRYADGVGVEIFGEVYTAMGATTSTFSVTYTDSNDVSRVGTYVMPANALTVGQMFMFNPPAGAVGCKSIQSVQLSATTGTAGNFGLVLVRRLLEVPIPLVNVATAMNAFDLGLPEIKPDACLATMALCTTTSTGNIVGAIDIIEG